MGKKKEPSIRISEKHGVNPSMGRCFWCGGETNEIALLGRLPGDAEAPRFCVLSYEPCDKCKEGQALGITLVEVTETPDGNQPPIQEGLYPTGCMWVVKPEMIKRVFTDELLVLQVLEKKKGFIDREAAIQIGLHLTPEEREGRS